MNERGARAHASLSKETNMARSVGRIFDKLRTAVNVWGDACGTAVVANLEGEQLNR